jgi:hypothetical protein
VRPKKRRLSDYATYFTGTGCIQFADGGVVELTVAEEELFELLLQTPKVTVPWPTLEQSMAKANNTIRTMMRSLRDKLGARAIRTHFGKGVSLQPHFVGSTRFALTRQQVRAVPAQGRLDSSRSA